MISWSFFSVTWDWRVRCQPSDSRKNTQLENQVEFITRFKPIIKLDWRRRGRSLFVRELDAIYSMRAYQRWDGSSL